MCKVGKFCIPQMQKCCFYIPLKKGLIGWGYFKMVFHVLLMFYALIMVIRFKQLDLGGYSIVVIIFIFIIVDIIMNVIFLKSLHEDSYRLMTSYYYYLLIMLILYFLVFLILTIITMIRDGDFFFYWPYMLQDSVIGCGNFALQIYFSELVKSHIHNLKFGFDPEIQCLCEEDKEEVQEKEKHDKKKDDNDDTDDSTTDNNDEKKDDEPGQSHEEISSKNDNLESEQTDIH